jgi:hypothetical protein
MASLGQTFDVNELPQGNGGNYDPLPAGWYSATIAGAELKPTKDGSGQYIKVRYDITGPSHQGRVVFGNVNIRKRLGQSRGNRPPATGRDHACHRHCPRHRHRSTGRQHHPDQAGHPACGRSVRSAERGARVQGSQRCCAACCGGGSTFCERRQGPRRPWMKK